MKIGLITTTLLLSATTASSQHMHQSNAITEAGQSQFAAIAEIVAVLRDDPSTDWTLVDVGALRDHLVDMDNVTTRAVVEQAKDGFSMTYVVTGAGAVSQSIQRMVLAHSPMLQRATGWSVMAETKADGAVMVVQAATQDEMSQMKGLGFFGLMTIGAHHQEHHVMIAKGMSPH